MSGLGPKTVFVCGVAGVGKTFLIGRVLGQFPGTETWRASAIIQEARKVSDPDSLRRLSTNEIALSQELLIAGLDRRRRESAAALIVLDGHSVIDTDHGLFEISVRTVERLRVQAVIHVEDAVECIMERRSGDLNRTRPFRPLQWLAEYQARSLRTCELYERELHIPLIRLRAGDETGLGTAIARVSADASDD